MAQLIHSWTHRAPLPVTADLAASAAGAASARAWFNHPTLSLAEHKAQTCSEYVGRLISEVPGLHKRHKAVATDFGQGFNQGIAQIIAGVRS